MHPLSDASCLILTLSLTPNSHPHLHPALFRNLHLAKTNANAPRRNRSADFCHQR